MKLWVVLPEHSSKQVCCYPNVFTISRSISSEITAGVLLCLADVPFSYKQDAHAHEQHENIFVKISKNVLLKIPIRKKERKDWNQKNLQKQVFDPSCKTNDVNILKIPDI